MNVRYVEGKGNGLLSAISRQLPFRSHICLHIIITFKDKIQENIY
jgi:hypothetical protein